MISFVWNFSVKISPPSIVILFVIMNLHLSFVSSIYEVKFIIPPFFRFFQLTMATFQINSSRVSLVHFIWRFKCLLLSWNFPYINCSDFHQVLETFFLYDPERREDLLCLWSNILQDFLSQFLVPAAVTPLVTGVIFKWIGKVFIYNIKKIVLKY